jgi:hypothetical protein
MMQDVRDRLKAIEEKADRIWHGDGGFLRSSAVLAITSTHYSLTLWGPGKHQLTVRSTNLDTLFDDAALELDLRDPALAARTLGIEEAA